MLQLCSGQNLVFLKPRFSWLFSGSWQSLMNQIMIFKICNNDKFYQMSYENWWNGFNENKNTRLYRRRGGFHRLEIIEVMYDWYLDKLEESALLFHPSRLSVLRPYVRCPFVTLHCFILFQVPYQATVITRMSRPSQDSLLLLFCIIFTFKSLLSFQRNRKIFECPFLKSF